MRPMPQPDFVSPMLMQQHYPAYPTQQDANNVGALTQI